jgi:hypothetical protein
MEAELVADDGAIVAVDDSRPVTPAVGTTEDVREIDRPTAVCQPAHPDALPGWRRLSRALRGLADPRSGDAGQPDRSDAGSAAYGL